LPQHIEGGECADQVRGIEASQQVGPDFSYENLGYQRQLPDPCLPARTSAAPTPTHQVDFGGGVV
jgi:hypothetical protein